MSTTLLILLLSLTGCGGSVRLPAVLAAAPTPQSVPVARSGTVFVGDSLFGRMDLDAYFPGKGYINAGWFGRRTDQILSAFPAILDGSNVCHGYQDGNDPAWPFSCQKITPPRAIVLLIGWNDLTQATSTSAAVANIKQMIVLAKAAGMNIYVCIPYEWDSAHVASWMQPWVPCSDLYPYRDSLPTLVSGTEADGIAAGADGLINLEWLFRAGPYVGGQCESGYTIDGLHPNDYGYWQIAAFISASANL